MTSALHRDYEIGPTIGTGRFGTVHRATSAVTGDSFAVKSVDKSAISDPLDLEGILLEAKLTRLAAVGNPNAVNVHAVYEDSDRLHLVLDLCPNGDLLDRLSSAPFSEIDAARILTQLMRSLAICHRRGIAHRDVKPENILFDEEDRVRLADFGSGAIFEEDEDEGARFLSGVFGTPYYVAPEVVEGREYGEKVDVWSAGVVMYVMLGGMVPFYGETARDVFEKVVRGNLRFPVGVFRGVSKEAKDLMRKMMCKDVERRLSAEQVLGHPWITSGGGEGLVEDAT